MSNCIPCHEIEGNKFLQSGNRDGVRILSARAVHISSPRKSTVAVYLSSTRNTTAVHISSTRRSTAAVHLMRADLVHKQFTLYCAHFQEGLALFSPPCHMYISASAFCFYKNYSTSFHSAHCLAQHLGCSQNVGGLTSCRREGSLASAQLAKELVAQWWPPVWKERREAEAHERPGAWLDLASWQLLLCCFTILSGT